MSSGLLIKFRSEFSQVNQGLDEARRNVSNFAQGVQNSLTAISFDSMTDVLGKMQSMLTANGLAMMVPAMELEDVSKQIGVMMGSSADGSALASSLQRLATNGVMGMQKLQDAAAALIGTFDDPGQIAQCVARFADISAGSKLSAPDNHDPLAFVISAFRNRSPSWTTSSKGAR